MSPVWMIEGGATAADPIFNAESAVGEPNGGADGVAADTMVTKRRFSALAAAVRDHESTGRHQAMPARQQDLALYRRLRQICGQR